MEKEISTKEKIFNTAVDLFTQKGFYETSVREIAAASDIQVSSLYNHFKSKEAILDAILEYYKSQVAKGKVSDELMDEIIEKNDPSETMIKGFHRIKESIAPSIMGKILHIIVIEKYRNPIVRNFYTEYSSEGKAFLKRIFLKMREKNLLKDHDVEFLQDLYISFVNNFYQEFYLLKAEGKETSELEEKFERHLELFFELFKK